MVRSGMPLSTSLTLLLLLLPFSTGAQVAERERRTHVVQPGETLTSIAVSYYGNAAEWRRILEANEGRIESPDRIRVGMELAIPGARLGAGTAHVISRVEVRPRSPGQALVPGGDPAAGGDAPALSDAAREEAMLEAVRERQALSRYSRFEPGPAPPHAEERTVFFEHPSLARREALIHAWDAGDLPPVPREIHRSAGWLVLPDEEFAPLGRVPDFAGDQDVRLFRTTVQHRDLVRGVFREDVRPAVGEELLLVRVDREVEDVGTVVVPTGRAVVRTVHEGGAVLEVVGEYDRIELGQHLVPDRAFPFREGLEPQPSDLAIEGRLLAFERERELQLPNDRAFLDVGRAHGVRPGDEFLIVLGEGEGWPGRVAARLQVVDVRERTATVRLLTITSREVRPGLTVRLDRRLP